MVKGKSFRRVTVRLHPIEESIIERACAALNGVERSLLMQEGVLAETNRLGICWSTERPPPLTAPWPYMPDRGDEPTEARVCVSVSHALAELIRRAREHVHASAPQFIIGSTLAYVGRLQRCFEGLSAQTPEEGARMRAALRKIKLPAHYQYRASGGAQ